MRVIREERDRIRVECAFCHGTGKDPFGVMSWLSTCYACLGQKSLWVPKPLRQCSYCQGTGVSPIGGRNYCIVCHGSGMVSIHEPAMECPACHGSAQRGAAGFYCWPCRGKGVVASQ